MKSNITVASNIYKRVDEDHLSDKAFIAQITGRSALVKLQNSGRSSDGISLSSWQRRMIKEDTGCSLAKNGEMSYGLVRGQDGALRWEKRCEYSQCCGSIEGECDGPVNIRRNIISSGTEEPLINVDDSYGWLGDVEKLFPDEEPQEHQKQIDEIVPVDAIIKNIQEFVSQASFTQIDIPEAIVTSPINSKILVNAAPGSGKTYTVIQRLEHIIREGLVDDLSSVLVLVYTNAARNEILNRLEDTLPYQARTVDVCTFDSFATSYLAAIKENFISLDYNGRIRLFNEKFDKDNFSNFEYVIVDELQDLVNERAKMTLNILGALLGGYLLLGDKCQAIYDYDCDDGDSVNSVEFYRRLEESLPLDVLKYELTGNKRQSTALAIRSEELRHALLELEPTEANEVFKRELSRIQRTEHKVETIDLTQVNEKTAILCRNNGEAEYVSHILRKKQIPHSLLRSVNQKPSLNRWIADCLWDYQTGPHITKEAFIERYCARVRDNVKIAASSFDVLSEIVYDGPKAYIEIEKLAGMLHRKADLPDLVQIDSYCALTVSTIHKAKGREFDTVYLLDNVFNPKNNTEEARVWYVGCTRAKNELYLLSKANCRLEHSTDKRWIVATPRRKKWGKSYGSFCSRAVVGLPEDVSDGSFAQGDISEALETQQYISEMVCAGDQVDITLLNNKYRIIHEGNGIGWLDEKLYMQLWNVAKKYLSNSKAPPHLTPVFVSNIVTITPHKFTPDVPAYYRESRFWLGVELTGFPKIDWHYGDTSL